jgi:hypothetical protein
MTEAPTRRKRLSKGRIRAIAWVTGVTTFFTGWGVLGMAPKPAASADGAKAKPTRPALVVHRILRRVVIVDPASGVPVRYVDVPGSGGSATGGAAPAPPPTTTTGGS